jgi:hypothetical protein
MIGSWWRDGRACEHGGPRKGHQASHRSGISRGHPGGSVVAWREHRPLEPERSSAKYNLRPVRVGNSNSNILMMQAAAFGS